jgi:hypothetical protein
MKKCLITLLGVLAVTGAAAGSKTVDRNVARPRLLVSGKYAYVKVRSGYVQVCCAVDARPPNRTVRQVRFRVRYGAKPRGVCRAVQVPVPLLAAPACRARDGSFWAIQSWQRLIPDFGGRSGPTELRVSHWTGPLAVLEDIRIGCRFRLPYVAGRATYRGKPIYGFHTTSTGVPLDDYGRLVALDTYDSPRYGRGWTRVSMFVPHRGSGTFSYLFRPRAYGTRLRLTLGGPGVTPDVRTYVAAPPDPC